MRGNPSAGPLPEAPLPTPSQNAPVRLLEAASHPHFPLRLAVFLDGSRERKLQNKHTVPA